MKFIKSSLFVLLSTIASFLAYLVFVYYTPYLLNMSWLWLFITFVLLGGVAISIISFLPQLISNSIAKLKVFYPIETIFAGIITTIFAIASIYLAWMNTPNWSTREFVAAIGQNIFVASVYYGLYKSLVKRCKNRI